MVGVLFMCYTFNMKNSQKGFIIPLVAVIVALVISGGAYVYTKNKQASYSSTIKNTQDTNLAQTTNTTVFGQPITKVSGDRLPSTFVRALMLHAQAIIEEYGVVNAINLKQDTKNFSGVLLNKEYNDKLANIFSDRGGPAGRIDYVIFPSSVSYTIKIRRSSQKDSFYCYDSSDKELRELSNVGGHDLYKIIPLSEDNFNLKADCKGGEILKGSESEGF